MQNSANRRNEKEDAPGVPADGTVVGIVEK